MVQKFSVSGMTCSACSQGIEKYISSLNGVNSVNVSLLSKEMTVDFDQEVISAEKIISGVEHLGYTADFYNSDKIDKYGEAKRLKKRFIISLILLLPLMYFSMGVMLGAPAFSKSINYAIQWVLATAIITINFKFYTNGVKAVFSGSPNMDTLVSLGSFSAYVYSVIIAISAFCGKAVSHTFFEASAMVLALVTLGKWLEELSKVKTGDAIEKLNKLIPKTATIIKDGKMITVLTSQIEVGDTVVLRMGDYVAIDGVVVEGTATVDKSAITGESIPEEIKVDDFISSGSIIKDGFLLVEAIQVGEDTLFSKIIDIVKNAGVSKAPVQRIADKVAGVFVPIVCSLAVIAFTVWFIVSGNLYLSIGFGISVLVISCPCSLGLATPVAVMATSGAGATRGILFKDASTMQSISKINCVLLDKTATITVGRPRVVEYKNLSEMSDYEVKAIVGAMESKSSHPLAECVKEFCGEIDFKLSSYEYLVGKGLKANCNGKSYSFGNRELLPDNIVNGTNFVLESEFDGKTLLYFSDEDKLLALFVVADYLKDDSVEAIVNLKGKNIKTVMITGDNYSVAKSVAEQVGIDTFEANVLPQDKYTIVEKYKKEGYYVAMVGDGINDSPALKSADVGIAMGTGTDIAIDSSDVIIANGSLTGLTDAIDLSKKSNRIIKENLFWAFLYNLIAIPVAGGVFAFAGISLTPAIASACMSLSSLFVVTNAFRIKAKRKIKNKKIKLDKIIDKHDYILVIDGMMCGHCKSKMEQALTNTDGVVSVDVDLKNKTARVITNTTIAEEDFNLIVNKAGYSLEKFSELKD